MNDIILRMTGIEKRFSGVHALKSASFELRAGEVHALMGENGAGKSTLIKVLSGIHKRDGGTIEFFGKPVEFANIAESQKAGISVIHQELNMMNHLTVAQNIYIGREPMKGIMIDDRKMVRSAGELFRHIGVTLYETLVSFVLVIFFSLFVTVLLWLFRKLSEILEPYLVVLNSLPKSALAPLLIVWLGANRTTIIIAGMSVAIFGSILNLYSEFSEVDPDKIMLIYTLHGNRLHALSKVVIPSCIPAIISTMKVNIGLCLVGVIIGEFIGGREGLGYMIIYGSQVFKLDWLLMSICILCVIAMLLYALIGLIEKWYLCRCKIS